MKEKAVVATNEVAKEEIVKLPTFTYHSIFGALGLQSSPSDQPDWERCRDRFQTKTESSDVKCFLFYHKDGMGGNVIEFMRVFEAAANVPEGEEIVFKKTTNANVLWVGMSEWWRYKVRRSLLTALLRCGQQYTNHSGDGFQEAINSEYYLSGTREALEWFMEGHTAVKLNKHTAFPGWYNFFYQKPKTHIESCLVKLKRRKKPEEIQNYEI